MDINSISLPSSESNVKKIQELAQEKQFSLHKMRNEELWHLKDLQSGKYVLQCESLMTVHEYLCHCDD